MRREPTGKHRAQRKLLRGGALLALALLGSAALLPGRVAPAFAQREETIVVIIAETTGVTDISSEVLRTAYLGLRSEYHGVRLIPFNLPVRTPVRVRLDHALLGLAPDDVGSFWVDQRVRDGRTPPRVLSSAELAVRVVAQLSGAIACVPASLVEPHVRALRIDGKGPSDRGYLLAPE